MTSLVKHARAGLGQGTVQGVATVAPQVSEEDAVPAPASAAADAPSPAVLANFSNNYGGACSHCSADNMCGPKHGGTVCPGSYAC
ncbi:uncharacterized protein MICPUCDRAFT_22453, partial [Micromonas pusilla CCMP1545]